MPNAKGNPRTDNSDQGLIRALVALPPSEDESVYALFEEQRKDCQITGGVPLSMEDLERVCEVLSRSSKVEWLVARLAALPATVPEHADGPYF